MLKNSTNILISACIITYNQENYIRQCLEGAVSQVVSFPYEIVVGVDKSNDDTKIICEEYQQRYPHLIRLVAHDVRLGMRGNSLDTISRCRGKYIAICEGDDSWTHPLKLKRQVSFLENNPDCSMCYHPTTIVYKDNSKPTKITGPVEVFQNITHKFSMDEVICGRLGLWTASIVFRSNILADLPCWTDNITFGDVALKLFCATKGKIGYIGPESMSIYNRNVENSWSYLEGKTMDWEERRMESHLEVLDYFDQYTNFEHRKAIKLQKKKMELQYILNIMKFYGRSKKARLLIKYRTHLFDFNNKLTTLIWFRFIVGEKVYNRILQR